MNILITGIHGFVGSNLVASLKRQHTIYGLDIVSPQKDGIKQTFSWNELQGIPPIIVLSIWQVKPTIPKTKPTRRFILTSMLA